MLDDGWTDGQMNGQTGTYTHTHTLWSKIHLGIIYLQESEAGTSEN